MTFRKVALSLAVLLLAIAPLALGQGTYTQIDYPGAAGTLAYGIDTAGDISGYYVDAKDVYHGFFLSDGVYTTIDYPDAQGTYIYGMNDEGQVVGFTAGVAPNVGFVYNLRTATFTKISYPGSSYMAPTCINNMGNIAGYFASNLVHNQGFELVGSQYKLIMAPRSFTNLVLGI
jgi:hypothetical protein